LTDQSIYLAAVVQLNSGSDVEANIAAADTYVREAAVEGARLVVLPEKWTVMGGPDELRAGAQPLDGRVVDWGRETARELGVDLVAGSMAERLDVGERLGNASVHIGPSGDVKAVYRKLHLFDVEIEGKPYRESDTDEPGKEIVLSELSDGTKLGLTVCYDVRFPELYRALALRGSRVVTVAAAFTVPTTRDHWETMVRARAIENQVFVLAANQVGEHPGGYRSGGHSMIVDPWGRMLARLGEEPGYAVAGLDFAEQDAIRSHVPLLEHRRPDIYSFSLPGSSHARPGTPTGGEG
jgi:deaminated glutathione amidase